MLRKKKQNFYFYSIVQVVSSLPIRVEVFPSELKKRWVLNNTKGWKKNQKKICDKFAFITFFFINDDDNNNNDINNQVETRQVKAKSRKGRCLYLLITSCHANRVFVVVLLPFFCFVWHEKNQRREENLLNHRLFLLFPIFLIFFCTPRFVLCFLLRFPCLSFISQWKTLFFGSSLLTEEKLSKMYKNKTEGTPKGQFFDLPKTNLSTFKEKSFNRLKKNRLTP